MAIQALSSTLGVKFDEQVHAPFLSLIMDCTTAVISSGKSCAHHMRTSKERELSGAKQHGSFLAAMVLPVLLLV